MVDRVEIVTGVTEAFKGDEPALKEMQQQETPVTESKPEDRPQWLPEKFKSAEDLAKAYSELEKRLGAPKADETPAPEKAEKEAKADPKAAPQVSTQAMQKYSEEYLREGGLSEASYAELSKMGVERALVDAYITGQRALAERQAEAVYQTVGGKDAYGKMVQWGQENMNETEIAAFNQVVRSGDMNQINLAVQGIYSRMKAEGQAPTLMHGKSASPSNGFRSTAEVVEAMRDPRYKNDSAYRADVERRLQNSNII